MKKKRSGKRGKAVHAFLERLLYKKKTKWILLAVQTICAGVLALCLLTIGFWMEDSYSLREMSKNFEESDLFFRQVDTILRNKIDGQDNDALFEEDGEYSGNKEIDIQSYGKSSSSVQDMNTTYLVSDLVTFCQSGGQQALEQAINRATQGDNRQLAGERLEAQAQTLETIHPVTGISLAECARWYSDSAGFVFDMYMQLNQVSKQIYERYQQYTQEQEESWSPEAPSNLCYCIENTATGELYTNLGISSYEEAASALPSDGPFVMLYEGERSYNIMVSNPDNVLNDAAADWYLEDRFVNSNEKIFLAINTEYPVQDELRMYADYFSHREVIVKGCAVLAVLCGVFLVAAFVFSVISAGWQEGRLATRVYWMDRIPTEIAGGLYVILGILVMTVLNFRTPEPMMISGWERIMWSIAASAAWLLALSAFTGFVRRLRAHLLWHNSICRMLLYTWKRVTAARAASGQLLFFYIIFFILNFAFLLFFGRVGIFMVFVLDMAVLLYLLRDMAGKQSVWEGIHQISKGDLQYKIDLATLTGETYEMARAVNEMGDGLQEAVEAIVRNERLKAELITNVSHDLKTPLTSIVNYVDLLKREHLEGERVQHYIEVLDQKSQRLKQLTEDLVEVSKISSGNVELHMMRLQVQSMLDQAYGEFEDRLEEKGLTAGWDMEKEPAYIMADGRQFWRVLENLLGNICKYALENSKVHIGLKKEDKEVQITLENQMKEALGISAEDLMGRFVRGDRSRNTEGSGLGLSIAKSLTELQGGTFLLELKENRFIVRLTFPEAEGE